MDKDSFRSLVIARILRNKKVTPLTLFQCPVESSDVKNPIIKDVLSPEGWNEIYKEIKNIANQVREEKISLQDLNGEESAENNIAPFTLEDIYKIEEWFDINSGMNFTPKEDDPRIGVANLIKEIENELPFSAIPTDMEYMPGYLFMEAPFMRKFAQYYLGFRKGKIRITIISNNETQYSTNLVKAVMDDRIHPGIIGVSLKIIDILVLDILYLKIYKTQPPHPTSHRRKFS